MAIGVDDDQPWWVLIPIGLLIVLWFAMMFEVGEFITYRLGEIVQR